MTLDPAVGWILAASIALLLAAAAVHKLRDVSRFQSVLAGYRLLPAAMVPLVARAVIGLEIIAMSLLLIPSRRPLGAALATTLLLVYAVALGVNLLRGRTRIDCGCLGFGQTERISWAMVVRNLTFATVTLVAALPPSSRPVGALDVVTIVGTVAAAAVLYAGLSQLASMQLVRGSAS